MKALDPTQNKNYKFLECEQADKIDVQSVYSRVKAEMENRMKLLTSTELCEKNMMKVINTKVIPVTSYVMNVCESNMKQIDEFDKLIKKVLRDKGMHGRQSSDERLYLGVENGGRGLKSMKDVYEETKVRVACYMAYQQSPYIKAAWKSDDRNERKSSMRYVSETLNRKNANIKIDKEGISENGNPIIGTWKQAWSQVKRKIREQRKKKRKSSYMEKRMQSEIYKGLEESDHQWMRCNMDPRNVSAIIAMH